MNIKLTEQKRLMQKAIDNLNHIEQIDRMAPHLDPEFVMEKTMQQIDEYAETVKTLVANFLGDSGMVLKEIPENKLAAIA